MAAEPKCQDSTSDVAPGYPGQRCPAVHVVVLVVGRPEPLVERAELVPHGSRDAGGTEAATRQEVETSRLPIDRLTEARQDGGVAELEVVVEQHHGVVAASPRPAACRVPCPRHARLRRGRRRARPWACQYRQTRSTARPFRTRTMSGTTSSWASTERMQRQKPVRRHRRDRDGDPRARLRRRGGFGAYRLRCMTICQSALPPPVSAEHSRRGQRLVSRATRRTFATPGP